MQIIMKPKAMEAFMKKIEKIAKQVGKDNIELLKKQRVSRTDKLGYPREPKGKNVVVIS